MLINKMFAAESKVDDNCHFEFPLYFHTNEFNRSSWKAASSVIKLDEISMLKRSKRNIGFYF